MSASALPTASGWQHSQYGAPSGGDCENTSWHFSDAYRFSPLEKKGYELSPPSLSDKEMVMGAYFQNPIPGLELKRVEVIRNPELSRQFVNQIASLNARYDKPEFTPRFDSESYPGMRRRIVDWQRKQTQIHQESAAPHVQFQLVWNGMPAAFFPSVCEAGYTDLRITDEGFGSGIYNVFEPQHAYEYATWHGSRSGVLVLNWVVTHSCFPVIDGDMGKLRGKGHYQNYDAHLIPVKPRISNYPKETAFLPCKPGEQPTYHKLVAFEPSSCLPKYRVEVGPPAGPRSALSLQAFPGEEDYLKGQQLLLLEEEQDALPYLEKAVRVGNPLSLVSLLGIHINQKSANEQQMKQYRQQLSEKIGEIRRLADNGQAEAQWQMGICYHHGEEVSQNCGMSVRYWKLAADQGHLLARVALGLCYFKGRGVAQNYEEAVKYWQLPAERGSRLARSNLGLCYGQGKGVSKNVGEAVRYWKLAAEQGDPGALINLGVCYSNGEGVTQNLVEAARYWKLAAEQGQPIAQLKLGFCYDKGKGVPQDLEEAVRYYRLAAGQGNAAAQTNLGFCYSKGDGVPQNLEEAVRWWKRAANTGFRNAQRALANCYEHGLGVPQNKAAAERYRKLAEGKS